jgi:hypothetical protein
MKKVCTLGLTVLLGMCSIGCQFGGSRDSGQDLDIRDYADDIQRFTELAASVAFLRDDIKEYKEPVCSAVSEVVKVLENIHEPEATFALIREAALNAIQNFEHPDFIPPIKHVTTLVVDQILNAVYNRVEGRFGNLLERADAVIVLSNAVATGLNNACISAMSISTFSVEEPANR